MNADRQPAADVHEPAGCAHWDGTRRARCAKPDTRRYLTGRRCTEHAPAAMRGAA